MGSLETKDHQVLQARKVSKVHLGNLVIQDSTEAQVLVDRLDFKVVQVRLEHLGFLVIQEHLEMLDRRAI